MQISSVFCGQNTTYAITAEDGQVLAWGDNKWGQLAHDPTYGKIYFVNGNQWSNSFFYYRNVAFFSCPLTIPSNYLGGERAVWLKTGWSHCAVGLSSGDTCKWVRAD